MNAPTTSARGSADAPPRGLRLWWLAVRPLTLTIALVPVVVGSVLAWAEAAAVAWLPFAAALLSAVLIQAGTNLHNDAADFERGTDRAGRVGPPRVTAAGWASPGQVRGAARLAFGLAALGGLYLVRIGGWPILAVGLASIAAGYAYSGGPRPISHTPLGELFVLVFFGLVAVAGSHYLQSGRLAPSALVAGAAVGALAAAVLMVNNYRDLESDTAAGRRTLAALLGRERARVVYDGLLLLPFALLAWLWWLLPARPGVFLAGLALPYCVRLARLMVRIPPGPGLNALLAGTARAQVLFGLLLSIGLGL